MSEPTNRSTCHTPASADGGADKTSARPPQARFAIQRTDPKWASAASAYIQAKRNVDAAQEVQLRAKEVLVALTKHSHEQGFGVTVKMSDEWRSIDNARTTELLGVDLERYSGKGCVGATVSIDV